MPFLPVALVMRLLVINHVRGQVEGTGIVVGEWELECMITAVFLLHCGVDAASLPILAPNAVAVEVGSLFCAGLSLLHSLATLIGLNDYLPPPCKMFSGRLLAHLHCRSLAVREMVGALVEADEFPEFEITQMKEGVMGLYPEPVLAPPPLVGDASPEAEPVDDENWREMLHVSDEAVQHASVEEHRESRVEETQAKVVRDRLPIDDHRDKIMVSIAEGPVTCIQGETGCGKSSLVPQFIVEDAEERGVPVKMLVTQPRRIAAVTLARRVAEQRGEEVGKSVGYKIGQGDHVDSKDSKITFVTVGYLLQYLSHNSPLVKRYTHIVLDEVHERSMDADMLNLLIKKLMEAGAWPNSKLVVMSATLQVLILSHKW